MRAAQRGPSAGVGIARARTRSFHRPTVAERHGALAKVDVDFTNFTSRRNATDTALARGASRSRTRPPSTVGDDLVVCDRDAAARSRPPERRAAGPVWMASFCTMSCRRRYSVPPLAGAPAATLGGDGAGTRARPGAGRGVSRTGHYYGRLSLVSRCCSSSRSGVRADRL